MKIKYLRPINDLHLDVDIYTKKPLWTPPTDERDAETCLIIAGDIWKGTRPFEFAINTAWIPNLAKRYAAIVFVLGNHDYWGEAVNVLPNKIYNLIYTLGLTNVYVLQNTAVVLNNIRFLGGTLWTNFNNGHPLCRFAWQTTMTNDANKIKYRIGEDYAHIRTGTLMQEHYATKNFIFKEITERNNFRATVVVTHMAPTFLAVDDAFKHETVANGYYATEFGNEIAEFGPDFWFYGHMHNATDFTIGNTRLINNPRGYGNIEPGKGWNPHKIIEL